MRRRYVFCVVTLFLICLIWLRLMLENVYFATKHGFDNFDNVTGSPDLIVPNIVHFILFGKNSLEFIPFLSILSALKVQQPEVVYIHNDAEKFGGYYWTVLQQMSFPNTSLQLVYQPRPTHVFGQPLSSIYHATDVARIQVLMGCGGIYIDSDTLVLRSLDRFRHFEMVVGWPNGEYMGTQVLVAHPDARFLDLWLNSYRRYHPREWYYNAGQEPTQQILEKAPYLVHKVPGLFGVQNLAARLYGLTSWPQWRTMFTVHLLSRHPPAPPYLDEKFVIRYRAPFGDIARWLLYKLEPKVKFTKDTEHYLYSTNSNTSICIR
ncbi:uncharacterized protein [Periplaneta americana]|uniref:uncharacterized protein n=1 Tax=Periplaneta americana TaxID=6978 RepID=UPI0037E87798